MAPKRFYGQKNEKQQARKQGRNPTSSNPNQSQGSGTNRGSQPSTSRDSQTAGRGNGNQQRPAPAAAQVPLHLRVTVPNQPSRNPGANAGSQTSQSTSGSPAMPQRDNKPQSLNQDSQSLGRQPPTGSTTTLPASTPVAAVAQAPSNSSVPSKDRELKCLKARMAAERENRANRRLPGRPATGPARGAKVGKMATPVSNPSPQTATMNPGSGRQALGAWGNYQSAIKAYDDVSKVYVYGRQGMNVAELDTTLKNSEISDAVKLQDLRAKTIAQDQILNRLNKKLTTYENQITGLLEQKEQWQQDKESMQSENEDKTRRIGSLEQDIECLRESLASFTFHQGPFRLGWHTSVGTLKGHGEIAKPQDEVEENGLEQQTPTNKQLVDKYTQTTTDDESLSQITGAVDEIISAGKHIENLYDDAQESQHQCEDDEESLGDLDTQEAVERNPFDFLDDEDLNDWMEMGSFGIDKLVSGTMAPLCKVADTSVQTETCPTVDVGVSASVEVVDSCVQTVEVEVATEEASTQTTWAEDVLSEVHVGVQVFPETKDSLVQTGPVITIQRSWTLGLFLMTLFTLWSVMTWFMAKWEEENKWLEVNGVHANDYEPFISFFWPQTLRYTLSVWLQVDQVMLG